MNIITENDIDQIDLDKTGGKGTNLLKLKNQGFQVPKFIILPADELQASIKENLTSTESIINNIQQYQFSNEIISEINSHFDENTLLAVRSSATIEDGKEYSFAGLFESIMYVPVTEIQSAIRKVWQSAYSERIQQYMNSKGIKNKDLSIAIILQEMVEADVSGVAFGANPANGDENEQVINAVFGAGEGLVSGQLNADMFHISSEGIKTELAQKTHQLIVDHEAGQGLKKVALDENKQSQTTLEQNHILEISATLAQLKESFSGPQDIEFAYRNGSLYILQSRPITTGKQKTIAENYILWDNSNIIESYPGVTTPLTFSFISQSYQQAYQLFSAYMGVDPKVIAKNQQVFKNTLGLIRGRVYYNLKTWYLMLAMLPGYSLNARYMETMMGVKERFDIPKDYIISKGQAYWSIVKTVFKMLQRMFSLPKKRAEFMQLLEETISKYKSIDYKNKSASELLSLYLDFEKKLLNEWKAPLLNDFFAMIWFGMLQKSTVKYLKSENPNIHNDLLCGSADIISTQPIHRSIAIATFINQNEGLKVFFSDAPEKVWQKLQAEENDANIISLRNQIDEYIHDFGERCVGELKLETLSYEQAPEQLIKILQSYVNQNISVKSTSGNLEQELRTNAEKEIQSKLKFKPIKKWWLKYILTKTRQMVSGRENLRYERTRAFGIVRKLFSTIGNRFYEEDLITHPRDIFYLTKAEIEGFIEGRGVFTDLKENIAIRKAEYAKFEKEDPPPERFATNGIVYSSEIAGQEEESTIDGELKGIGCCPGKVRAKVRKVNHPQEVDSLNGDILVTSSTDPGWVTLFPSASGIIVERGSLLSHSAIVSREMGIPCIVSVSGLLKQLKSGDEVLMDGSSGIIKILESK
ncbi:PEP/pyruvate-binding domain-containing protein [Marivirga harenae]|uniref:PEP/pyruvate-binding domain-containing protein n=1 Tax=Marivirga harenae TaxID=2010992 RepID=UPI0026DF6450|nr:PEP/pyruvate-binding domain-containing protein [Marivirga harenae]WKV12588.1 PEP/pyruvate-binding domain-containing protein [Marivirga harenae]|tara:strand:- start:46802 stop:49408 length:2607 start_codon:yes stop_codon:yes gene_type:complete